MERCRIHAASPRRAVPTDQSHRDADASGTIEPGEINRIWTQELGEFPCELGGMTLLEDGSSMSTMLSDRVCRMVDANNDGRFFDVGEVHIAYDELFATQYGQAMNTRVSVMAASTK
jgi:hypothetical protein